MKFAFIRNYNNILNDIRHFFHETTNLLESDLYLGWQDLTQPDKRIVEMCAEYKKPSYIIEHGMFAVSDYDPELSDIVTGMGAKKVTASKFFVWGERSKNLLLKSGYENVEVIGSPVIYRYEYRYEYEDENVITTRFMGDPYIEPITHKNWRLRERVAKLPSRERKNFVLFIPHHDYSKIGIAMNKLVWDKIKDRPDIIVKLSASYSNKKPENPFLEFITNQETEKNKRYLFSDTNNAINLNILQDLMRKAAVCVTTIPGTINGFAWAYDVPILCPKVDFGWRDQDGNILYNTYPADDTCELDDLNLNIDFLLNNPDKNKENRALCASEFLNVKLNPDPKNLSLLDPTRLFFQKCPDLIPLNSEWLK